MKTILIRVLPVLAGAAIALAVCHELAGYHVPLALIVASGLGIFGSITDTLIALVAEMTATVHRCAEPDCDFRVRLVACDAIDNRRWQEIAASHPHHA